MTEEEWTYVRHRDRHLYEEKRPYQECPNCGKYKYTTRKKIVSQPGIIFGKNKPYVYKLFEYCENCKLRHNKRRVEE